jgi:hypothetical protein
VKPIQTRQNSSRIHVARGLKGLADVFDQFIGIFHHVTVAIRIPVRHTFPPSFEFAPF